jgi:hypothetical protein
LTDQIMGSSVAHDDDDDYDNDNEGVVCSTLS